jgi:ABC-type antimicrobial peptide transport system permease subunit
VRHVSLTAEATPVIYTAVSSGSIPSMMVAIRTADDPLALVPAVREAIRRIDRNVPISDVQTMRTRVGTSLDRPRFVLLVLSGVAGIGLVLAIAGIAGVVAYSAARRRRELGIMVALGARPGRILRLVLSEGLGYAAAGLAIGLPVAVAASRLLRSLVFGVTPTDPATYAILIAVIVLAVLLACGLPARRAARADPLAALRVD